MTKQRTRANGSKTHNSCYLKDFSTTRIGGHANTPSQAQYQTQSAPHRCSRLAFHSCRISQPPICRCVFRPQVHCAVIIYQQSLEFPTSLVHTCLPSRSCLVKTHPKSQHLPYPLKCYPTRLAGTLVQCKALNLLRPRYN
jgi:hypothetical protein